MEEAHRLYQSLALLNGNDGFQLRKNEILLMLLVNAHLDLGGRLRMAVFLHPLLDFSDLCCCGKMTIKIILCGRAEAQLLVVALQLQVNLARRC